MAARLKVVIDCETRSQNADVTVCGPHKYSLDPTTVMLCWGYQINGERHLWRPTDNEEPKLLIDAVRNGALVFAHNVFFEWCIWNNIMVPYFGWPPIPESSWRDTMAQGNAIGLPNSLEDASMAAHLTKEKNLEGRRVMLQLTKPRAPSKLNPDLYFNDEERFGKLYEYCLDDCEVEDML